MTIQQFFDKWNGKLLDYDKAYGGQCVDVYDQFCLEVVNAPIILVEGAVNIWDHYPQDYFEKIENTPEGVPQKGDVVIWGKGIGFWGHVGIFNEGNVDRFTSFDQNFPSGSLCHFQEHNYTGVLGWLRPKLPQDQQLVIDELRIARDKNWNLYQEEVSKNNELDKEIKELQTKNQDLREINSSITEADANLGVQLLDAQHKADELVSDLNSIKKALGASQEATVAQIIESIGNLTKPNDEVVKEYTTLAKVLEQMAFYKRVPKKAKTLFDKLFSWIRR